MPETNQISRRFKVENKMGIHARPAAMIVRTANKYNDSDIWVQKGDEQINGKSIMGLMMLAAGNGTELQFIASGPNAEKVLDDISQLFSRKFDEA